MVLRQRSTSNTMARILTAKSEKASPQAKQFDGKLSDMELWEMFEMLGQWENYLSKHLPNEEDFNPGI